MQLNNTPEGSTPQLGKSDPIIELLNEYGIPVNRENYLELAYLGEPPEELGAEQELALPEQVRA